MPSSSRRRDRRRPGFPGRPDHHEHRVARAPLRTARTPIRRICRTRSRSSRTSEEAARLLALVQRSRSRRGVRRRHVARGPRHAGARRHHLDLSRMTRILEVSQADMDCRVEAGVTRVQLNEHLRPGPVLPGRSRRRRTLGGMARDPRLRHERRSLRHDARERARPDGRPGRRPPDPAPAARAQVGAGYDLTRLFVGSEGTLGVITEVQLRLHGIPETISAAVCQFDALEALWRPSSPSCNSASRSRASSCSTTCRWPRASPIRSSRAEPVPTLFLEFHGTEPASPGRRCRSRRSRPSSARAVPLGRPMPEERNRLWKARHDAYWAARALKPGHGCSRPTPACRSRGSTRRSSAPRDITASGLIAPIVGHVGDGNFHTAILAPPDGDGLARAWELDRKSSPAPWRSAARAAASMAWGSASASFWSRSTARRRSPSCARSRPRSIPARSSSIRQDFLTRDGPASPAYFSRSCCSCNSCMMVDVALLIAVLAGTEIVDSSRPERLSERDEDCQSPCGAGFAAVQDPLLDAIRTTPRDVGWRALPAPGAEGLVIAADDLADRLSSS